jgi:hypothetical protein
VLVDTVINPTILLVLVVRASQRVSLHSWKLDIPATKSRGVA